MNTLLGIEVLFGPTDSWPTPYPLEIIVGSIIVILLISLLVLVRYNIILKNRQSQAHQLFLFKARQLGLSNYQFKIINGLVNISSIRDPNDVLLNPSLFENSIGLFLDYLKKTNEKADSLANIGKDLIITYEKIFHPVTYRKPITKIDEIDKNTLICLIASNDEIIIGKTLTIDDSGYYIKMFRKTSLIQNIIDNELRAYLWRSGDAEYTFETKIINYDSNAIQLSLPIEFIRGKEVRLPYIEVMIQCTVEVVSNSFPNDVNNKEIIAGNIFKINESEAVVRLTQNIDYQIQYLLSFEVESFKIIILSKLLADRTIHEQGVHYYTFKFVEISDIAEKILKQYITKHL